MKEPIPLAELRSLAADGFGDMVKAVVDIELELMAVGGELHSDEEALLLDHGSKQRSLWGINLYPDQFPSDDWLEADSMINIRPAQGNRSRSIEDPTAAIRVREVVAKLVQADD